MSAAQLAAFVRARLDDTAREQQDHETAWHARECASIPDLGSTAPLFECDCGVPARVLAEVEAKRQLINHLTPTEVFGWSLRLLALPYADHPDYREEWRL